MIAYGYEVKGWKEALADVQRNLDNPGCRINVDHEAKTVILD